MASGQIATDESLTHHSLWLLTNPWSEALFTQESQAASKHQDEKAEALGHLRKNLRENNSTEKLHQYGRLEGFPLQLCLTWWDTEASRWQWQFLNCDIQCRGK